MPTLNWIGKDAVIRHHKDVPFRLLEPDAGLSHGDGSEGNLIVEGDNLHALKALLPKYAGKVKCIYIDPPYNTGNEGWVYNDNVKAPEITKWLGQVVGKEAEDLSRHDKWLCMMYPRLVLLKQFLREDGVIMASIDDNEVASLKFLLDEVFGKRNFMGFLIWNTEGNTDNQFEIKINHEHIAVYGINPTRKSSAIGHVIDPNTPQDSNLRKGLADNNINKNNPANPPAIFEIPVGFPCTEEELFYPAKELDENFFSVAQRIGMVTDDLKVKYRIENNSGLPVKIDDLVVKDYRVVAPCRVFGGFANRRKLEKFVMNGLNPINDDGTPLRFYLNGNAAIRYRRENENPRNILSVLRGFGTTEQTSGALSRAGIKFSYPKPVNLIDYLLRIAAEDKDSIILDSFAGSGTTAHAVLKQNAEDGGNRKFILVEMEEKIAQTITAERVRRVAGGYSNAKGEEVAGLGSGFQYCRLSEEPLFNEFGDIRDDVTFAQLADFVWFSETGLGFTGASDSPLLGVHESMAVYLLFNGILGDRRPQGGNILTKAILDALPPHDGPKVIYAAATRLGNAALQREQVIFKQTPYAIEV